MLMTKFKETREIITLLDIHIYMLFNIYGDQKLINLRLNNHFCTKNYSSQMNQHLNLPNYIIHQNAKFTLSLNWTTTRHEFSQKISEIAIEKKNKEKISEYQN